MTAEEVAAGVAVTFARPIGLIVDWCAQGAWTVDTIGGTLTGETKYVDWPVPPEEGGPRPVAAVQTAHRDAPVWVFLEELEVAASKVDDCGEHLDAVLSDGVKA